MKTKTIKKELNKAFTDWKESITDENVKKLVEKNTIITGGSIASMFLQEPVNDYDLYFTNKETVEAVAKYYVEESNRKKSTNLVVLNYDDAMYHINGELQDLRIKGRGFFKVTSRHIRNFKATFEYDEHRVKIYSMLKDEDMGENEDGVSNQEISEEYAKQKYHVQFISANAITLSDKIQIITRFYGDHTEIHKNFDFVHATNYWLSEDSKLYTNTEALECLLSKTLIYRGSRYPLASIFRAKKFILRDFRIDAGQYLKMAFQLNDMDLLDATILEEQLTGVDMAYFQRIINDFIEAKKDENFTPSSEYFIKVIERIFE